MVFGGNRAWNLHRIVSHAKNGSPTTLSNQADSSLKNEGHDNGIFERVGIVIGPARDGAKTALFVQHLRGLI